MFNKSFLSFLFFTILSISTYSQIINIVLIDSLSKEPVPFAHISFPERSKGIVTNENGEFILEASELPVEICISHIAFLNKKIILSSDTLTNIGLSPNVRVLDEIVVNASAYTLANKIFKKLKEEKPEVYYGKAFYRQLAVHDTLPTEFIEAFYDLSTQYDGIKQVAIEQARFARKVGDPEKQLYLKYSNFSYLSTGFSLYAEANSSSIGRPFGEDFFNNYHFSILKTYLKHGEEFVVLDFKPENNHHNLMGAGQIVYNKSKGKIMQYTMTLDHALGVDANTNKANSEMRLLEPQHKWIISFDEDHAYPTLIQVFFTYKLKQNDNIAKARVQSNFLVYEQTEKASKKLRAVEKDAENISIFENAKYRPNFWKDNPIIKRTPEEDKVINTFEEQNAFGTYFK